MKTTTTLACIGLALFSTGSMAQWNNWGMPGYGNQPTMPQMPYGGGYTQPRYAPAPQAQPFNMMPFASQRPAPVYSRPPVYNQPPAQPFGGMMPWGAQPQPQYQAPPPQQPMMMPGMEQGIRSMMQPGKIMAEEATPGMHVQPTWR